MTMDDWSPRTELPLGAAAALFLGAYAWPIINPNLNEDIAKVCTLTTLVVWALFVVDYVVRVRIADDRRHYVLHHIPDLLVIALPLLRPLRLLRLIALLRIMNRSAAGSLRGKVAIYVTGGVCCWCSSRRWPCSTLSEGNPGPTSRTSGTRSGGH